MSDKPSSKATKLALSLDLRWISVGLAIVVVILLAMWRPWNDTTTDSRTVEVTGSSTISAKPDEFVFSPSYDFKNADKSVALAEMTKKSDEIVAKLKSLGVDESKIKTDSSGYDYPMYYDDGQDATYTLSLTITTSDLKLTQKVQDYLVTTSPTGSVSPEADFSDKKRNQLESQARDEATKDARAKADQMAKNLGFKVGKVKAIDDSNGFDNGGIMPMTRARGMSASSAEDATSLSVQPGQNDLDYSITVTYYIK